jgi:L-ascorbate metabolism protein UlaG (beta-lactamase superfamily)
MKITWYGYSCSHLETGYRIFIEPFLEDKPRPSPTSNPTSRATTHGSGR